MRSTITGIVLLAASLSPALALPQPAVPIITPGPVHTPMARLAKRQALNSGDLVASISGGSAISKMYSSQMGNATASMSPACTPVSDPDEGVKGSQCDCGSVGAVPELVPQNVIGTWDCAYSVVAATSAPSSAFSITRESGYIEPLPTPFVTTNSFGEVWSYSQESVFTLAGTPATLGAGVGTVISTVASIASAAAAQASDNADWAQPLCEWASLSEYRAAINWGLILPHSEDWMMTYDYDTAVSNVQSALKASTACQSFTSWKASSVGDMNMTFASQFSTDIFCTAYDMTNIIKSATNSAYAALACGQADDADTNPESVEGEPGESEPEDPEA